MLSRGITLAGERLSRLSATWSAMLPPRQGLLGGSEEGNSETTYVSTQRIRVQREKSQGPPDLIADGNTKLYSQFGILDTVS